jgi:hypothetical protein
MAKTATRPVPTKALKGKKEERGRSGVVVSPVIRASFPYVHKPDSGGEFSKDNYKITCLIDKKREVELKPLKQACLEAARQIWPIIKFDELEHPFKDGDDSKLDSYHGCIHFTAKSNRKPGVVGADKLGLPEGVEVYGGCYARVSVSAFTYTRPGEVIVEKGGKRFKKKEELRGVSLALNNVQFIKDGERFGGGSTPQEDFTEIDPSEYDDISENESFDKDKEPEEEAELEEIDEDELM